MKPLPARALARTVATSERTDVTLPSHFGSSPSLLLLSHCPLSSLWLAISDIAGDCAEGIKEYTRTSMQIPSSRCSKSTSPRAAHCGGRGARQFAELGHYPHCGILATVVAYTEGIGYALEQLTTQVPKVSVFLDAARGGWVGWEDNLDSSTLRCLGQRHHRQGLELLARMLQGRSGEDEEGGLKHAGRQHPEARPRLMHMRAHRARLAHPRLPYMNAFVIHPHV